MIAAQNIIELADGGGYAVYDGSQAGTLIVQTGDNLPDKGMWLRDLYDAAVGGGGAAAPPPSNGDGDDGNDGAAPTA